MKNDLIIGNPKEEKIRAFIYKCLIVDKLPKLKIVEAIKLEFGLCVGATTLLNYYHKHMFWGEIKEHIDNIRQGIIKGIETEESEEQKVSFCESTYNKAIEEYGNIAPKAPQYLIELVAEAAGLLYGNISDAKKGRCVLKSELTANFQKIHKALQDAM